MIINLSTKRICDSRETNISKSFTHKMAAKTSLHRYGTKLRHCQSPYVYRHKLRRHSWRICPVHLLKRKSKWFGLVLWFQRKINWPTVNAELSKLDARQSPTLAQRFSNFFWPRTPILPRHSWRTPTLVTVKPCKQLLLFGILSRTPWKPVADPLWSADPSLKTAALARPAAPLATCVQRHPGTETNKMWLPWRRPLPAVQIQRRSVR